MVCVVVLCVCVYEHASANRVRGCVFDLNACRTRYGNEMMKSRRMYKLRTAGRQK